MCRTEKYFHALKCILAAQSIDPENPKCHELSGRFKFALDGLPEPLPPKAQEVVQSTFLSKYPSKSVDEINEEYLSAHKDSASHVQAVVRLRQAIKPNDDVTKQKSGKDMIETLKSDKTSLSEALDGLRLLEGIGPQEAREQYLKAAHERWSEADAFAASAQ
jgi:N-alpha-acetyltransferase 15/16, NatA auxiliary subunit